MTFTPEQSYSISSTNTASAALQIRTSGHQRRKEARITVEGDNTVICFSPSTCVANAVLTTSVINDGAANPTQVIQVRIPKGFAPEKIRIPFDTCYVSAINDTTTGTVTLTVGYESDGA